MVSERVGRSFIFFFFPISIVALISRLFAVQLRKYLGVCNSNRVWAVIL